MKEGREEEENVELLLLSRHFGKSLHTLYHSIEERENGLLLIISAS